SAGALHRPAGAKNLPGRRLHSVGLERMALEQKLSLRLAQKLVMTPSLQQAIKLLQMTRIELDTLLIQELVENPVIEESSEVAAEEPPPREEERPEPPPNGEALNHTE